MRKAERRQTLGAMVVLCLAQALVQWVPLRFWRRTLGHRAPLAGSAGGRAGPEAAQAARRIAAHVERGAGRLPFTCKCLPQAMALCWLLAMSGAAYRFKIAVRPAAARVPDIIGQRGDDLHAWVEVGNSIVLGDLPGPWLEVLVLYG